MCPPSPLTDVCRPVLGSDAPMNQRTLFERSELGRSPQARVRPTLNETGRGVNLHSASRRARPLFGPFAPQQRFRPSGRTKQVLGCRAETRQLS